MRLSAIHVHPIKSLRGVAVTAARALAAGLEHDRRWMLVDEDGRFVSLREEPTLARLRVELVEGGYRVAATDDALRVPTKHEGARVPVRVWSSPVEAVVHEPGSAFFSAQLHRALRLVYLPDDVVRAAGSRARPGARVSLADAYPYLLIGQASLDELRRRLGDRLDGGALAMTRFRPNLVVSTEEPHVEDGWGQVRIGEVSLRGVGRCDRCVVTTLDPHTGTGGPEPLRTLAGYRREDGKVWFGMYFVPQDEGWLRVGDEVVASDDR